MNYFAILIAIESLGASGFEAIHGNWPKAIYWMAGAIITASTLWMK